MRLIKALNRYGLIMMLSIICIACLRSFLEASTEQTTKPSNHWQTLTIRSQQLAQQIQQTTDPQKKRQLENKLAQLYKQEGKLYDSSLLMSKEWTQGLAEDKRTFRSDFMENADSLAGLYMIEGNLESSKDCYERLLAYDTSRLGSVHACVARDYNNLGVVNFMTATKTEEKAKRDKLLDASLNYFSQAQKVLQQLKSATKDSADKTILSNIAFAKREQRY